MGTFSEILGTPLGFVMKLCYSLARDYGLSIIIFTLLTKIILFPVSIMVQKNSIKMIKMKPQLDALKHQYTDDKDALLDAQSDLYKREKYSPFAGTIPLLIQLPLIFGLINVVYRPLRHLLHLQPAVVDAFIGKTAEIAGLGQLGSSPELVVLQFVNNPNHTASYLSLQNDVLRGTDVASIIGSMQSMNLNFLGLSLAATPSLLFPSMLLIIPMLAGASALIMSAVQNRINVLQVEQSAYAKWGMAIFMVAFSSYFALLVPAGVGLYWICGNLFSIPVMIMMNRIYNPKEYIDYVDLNKLRTRAAKERKTKRQNAKLSRKYYRDICRNNNLQNISLLFYSEQGGFYKYYRSIIDALLWKTDEIVYYVTSDSKDPILTNDCQKIKSYYISGNQLIALMMKLECKLVVMTTPDLEKYHIKRSKVKRDIEYIFVDHSCTSLNLSYRTGALDHFDTIFVCSKNQGIEVREIEKLRGVKQKRIVKVGYGLLDNMIAAYNGMEKEKNRKPVILIAPSWQFDNILDSCLDSILSELICDKYKVIVRPHPQYIIRFPHQMESIIDRYRDRCSDDFVIETDFSSNATVYTADMVVTDWSGIAYEFSFATDKPVLFINTQMKIINKDYDKIRLRPFEILTREIIGKSISKEEAATISEVVDDLLSNQESYAQKVAELKRSYIYNLGFSGEVAADYIVERLAK
ncbi:MAG: membrane protein insertase YidC [Christensenellales bacterium]